MYNQSIIQIGVSYRILTLSSMILTTHLLTGAAIAVTIHNPVLGGIFALLSHYFLDLLPHHEYSIHNFSRKQWSKSKLDFLKIMLDLFFGFSIIFLTSKNLTPAFFGGILGTVADALTVLFFIFPTNIVLSKHYAFHHGKIHSVHSPFPKNKVQLFGRFLIQLTVSFIAIFFLLR